MNVAQAQLSVVFVTDRKIKLLNKAFLGHDKTTDVISFDLTDDTLSRSKKKNIKRIEGEIIVSAVTAFNNAKIYKTSPYQELVLYVIHGILHLLGYDDHSTADIKRIRKKEKELMALKNLGLI